MNKRVIIVGAGIAGFTAGINLLQKGYDVTIVEKNHDVGGLCFGYFVKGHYIDACLHWLMGTNKKSGLYKEWENIGALGKGIKTIALPRLARFEYEGTTVTFYRDLDRTEKELLELSPKDKHAIKRFIGSVRDMGSIMGMLLKNKGMSPEQVLRSLPHSAHIIRCMRETREDYAEHFKHPAIQFAIRNAQTGYNNMFFFLDFYGLFATGNADVPEGGAYYMVQRIKERYESLGGKLMLDTKVTGFEMEKNVIRAAKTDKGLIEGDRFVSTIDPLYTLRTLLDDKYKIRLFSYLESTVAKRSISSCFNVYVAVDADVSRISVPTIIQTEPMQVGAHKVSAMLIRPYHFDAIHFIKDGKTVVSLFIDQDQDDYAFYKSLDEKDYYQVSRKTADAMVNAFKKRFPKFTTKVEILSYFSPLELEERTNTSFGSIQSYSFTDRGMFYVYPGKVRAVKNLYLCGQWTRAVGGTPTALLTGVEICKQFDDGAKRKVWFDVLKPLRKRLKKKEGDQDGTQR